MLPKKMSAMFQIVVPINERIVNNTIFILLMPAGMVINTRKTGIKRQSQTAIAPYFLNHSLARAISFPLSLIHFPYLSTKRYKRASETILLM